MSVARCQRRVSIVIDGVFDTTAAGEVVFYAVTELDPNAITSIKDSQSVGPWFERN